MSSALRLSRALHNNSVVLNGAAVRFTHAESLRVLWRGGIRGVNNNNNSGRLPSFARTYSTAEATATDATSTTAATAVASESQAKPKPTATNTPSQPKKADRPQHNKQNKNEKSSSAAQPTLTSGASSSSAPVDPETAAVQGRVRQWHEQLDACVRNGNLTAAESIVKELENPAHKTSYLRGTWTLLSTYYERTQQNSKAVELLGDMLGRGLRPLGVAVYSLTKRLTNVETVRLLDLIHKHTQFPLNPGIVQNIVDAFRRNAVGSAALLKLSEVMRTRNISTNLPALKIVMAVECANDNGMPRAAELLRQARDSGLAPPTYFDRWWLMTCANHDYLDGVRDCYEQLKLSTEPVEEGLITSGLVVAARHGDVKLAENYYNMHNQQPGVGSCLAMLSLFTNKRDYRRAFGIISYMEQHSLISESLDTLRLLSATCGASIDEMDKAYFTLEDMLGNKEPVSIYALNAIIRACGERYQWERAYGTFAEIQKFGLTPNLDTYNALLAGCARHKLLPQQERIFKEMLVNNIRPNLVSYELAMLGNLRSKRLDRAVDLFNQGKQEGVKFRPDMYAALALSAHREKRNELIQQFTSEHDALYGRDAYLTRSVSAHSDETVRYIDTGDAASSLRTRDRGRVLAPVERAMYMYFQYPLPPKWAPPIVEVKPAGDGEDAVVKSVKPVTAHTSPSDGSTRQPIVEFDGASGRRPRDLIQGSFTKRSSPAFGDRGEQSASEITLPTHTSVLGMHERRVKSRGPVDVGMYDSDVAENTVVVPKKVKFHDRYHNPSVDPASADKNTHKYTKGANPKKRPLKKWTAEEGTDRYLGHGSTGMSGPHTPEGEATPHPKSHHAAPAPTTIPVTAKATEAVSPQ